MAVLAGCNGETRAPSDVAAKTVEKPATSGVAPQKIANDKSTPTSAGSAAAAAAASKAVVAPAPATPPAAPTAAVAKALLGDKDPEDVELMFPSRKRPSEPLPEELQRRIRNRLRDVSKAPIALIEAIYLPREDGSAEVLAIYELSTYEDCVLRYGGPRKEARARCLPELQEVRGNMVRLNRKCLSYGVAHASLGATAKGARLQVTHFALSADICKIVSLRQFFLDDVDRDKKPELVLEAIGEREELFEDGRAQNWAVGSEGRSFLWVLEIGEEMTEQIHFSMSDDLSDDPHWVDLNHDGLPDLVQIEDCVNDGYDPEVDSCSTTIVPRIWHIYDREQDRWINDEPENPDNDEASAGGNGGAR